MKYYCVVILIAGLCHGVSNAAECTTQGRFPNNDTEDCRGFTMCLNINLTEFTQYKLKCPIGSVYSHIEQQCTNSTDYQCLSTFNCTAVGNYVDPASNNCSSYIACPQGVNETVTARQVQCLPNMIFSPAVGVCINVTEYRCPSIQPSFPSVVEDDLIVKAEVAFNSAVNLSVTCMFMFLLFLLSCGL